MLTHQQCPACLGCAASRSANLFAVLSAVQEVSLASCVFEGDGLSACVAGSTASLRLRACDARGYTVASATADFTLTVVVDGKEIPGVQQCHRNRRLNRWPMCRRPCPSLKAPGHQCGAALSASCPHAQMLYLPNCAKFAEEIRPCAGGIVNHGEGNYEASYVVTRAGEYQLVCTWYLFWLNQHAVSRSSKRTAADA